MPLTPLHYPAAYAVYRLDRRLSLPGLIVGSMFPDLEIPPLTLLFGTPGPNRLVLHSLLGAATVGTLLSLAFTVVVYPPLVHFFFGVDRQRVESKTRWSFSVLLSVFLGNISHVLLDVVNHCENPLFWPFSEAISSPICLNLGGAQNASLIAHAILIIACVMLIIGHRRNLWEQLLVGE